MSATPTLNTYQTNGVRVVTPTAFLVPVLNRWLYYAPLQQVAALVNESAAKLIGRGDSGSLPSELADLLDVAGGASFVPPVPREGGIVPSILGIIPTRSCNMRCAYCHFGGSSAPRETMPEDIAIGAVDWAADRLTEADQEVFHVQFFGGEPFFAPDIVELIVHRVREESKRSGLVPYFDATTNGLFNERVCRFIGDHFDGIVLSLDGPPEFQDKYRPAGKGRPSSAIVEHTAHRLSEMPLSLTLRMCVTSESVERMEEIAQWMIETFHPSTISFETLSLSDLANNAALSPPDPFLFARNAERAFRRVEAAGVDAIYASAEPGPARLSFCPVGEDAVIVSPDGRLSACYLLPEDWQLRGLDLDFGRVQADRSVVLFSDRLEDIRRLPVFKPRCQSCFCQYGCAGGCHVHQTYPGSSGEYTDFCIQTRLLTACRLLRDLECNDMVSTLMNSREAMERLALQTSDCLKISVECHPGGCP